LGYFDEERAQNRPKKRSRVTFLHLNNATPRRVLRVFNPFGIARLLHPPNSLDFVPCDFWLFGTLERMLEKCMFTNPVEVMTEGNAISARFFLSNLF
jgi:hypothetical protein